ncbi:MAG: hypothetical protein AB8B69_26565 [Chitinophagales bacterium]
MYHKQYIQATLYRFVAFIWIFSASKKIEKMYPQFEGEVKIEHLQGYLYVQQLIENSATANAGAMKEYSIYEIEEKADNLDLIDLAISLILDRVKKSTEINETHHTFF